MNPNSKQKVSTSSNSQSEVLWLLELLQPIVPLANGTYDKYIWEHAIVKTHTVYINRLIVLRGAEFTADSLGMSRSTIRRFITYGVLIRPAPDPKAKRQMKLGGMKARHEPTQHNAFSGR